jgi:hypothetical protein
MAGPNPEASVPVFSVDLSANKLSDVSLEALGAVLTCVESVPSSPYAFRECILCDCTNVTKSAVSSLIQRFRKSKFVKVLTLDEKFHGITADSSTSAADHSSNPIDALNSSSLSAKESSVVAGSPGEHSPSDQRSNDESNADRIEDLDDEDDDDASPVQVTLSLAALSNPAGSASALLVSPHTGSSSSLNAQSSTSSTTKKYTEIRKLLASIQQHSASPSGSSPSTPEGDVWVIPPEVEEASRRPLPIQIERYTEKRRKRQESILSPNQQPRERDSPRSSSPARSPPSSHTNSNSSNISNGSPPQHNERSSPAHVSISLAGLGSHKATPPPSAVQQSQSPRDTHDSPRGTPNVKSGDRSPPDPSAEGRGLPDFLPLLVTDSATGASSASTLSPSKRNNDHRFVVRWELMGDALALLEDETRTSQLALRYVVQLSDARFDGNKKRPVNANDRQVWVDLHAMLVQCALFVSYEMPPFFDLYRRGRVKDNELAPRTADQEAALMRFVELVDRIEETRGVLRDVYAVMGEDGDNGSFAQWRNLRDEVERRGLCDPIA